MKGPSLRLKFDIRRRWECPVCHARVRSSGAVTSATCVCSQQMGTRNLMHLIVDGEPMLRWRNQTPVATTAVPASEVPDPVSHEVRPDSPSDITFAADSPEFVAGMDKEMLVENDDSLDGN